MQFFRDLLSKYYVYWVEVLVIVSIVMFLLYVAATLNLFKKE